MSDDQHPGTMSVAEAIRRKRAVRAYTSEPVPEEAITAILNAGRRAQSSKNTQPWTFEPVPEEAITAILNAGRRAQSSKNTQPWTFVLVTEREQLARLAAAGTYAAHMPASAFTVVLVAPSGTEFDQGQAAANMQLAATALGIGSCVTTLHNQELAREVLGVPAELSCRWTITFGYSAEADRPLKTGGRRSLDEVVRRERYG